MSTPNSFNDVAAMRNMPQNFFNLPGDSEIWESLKQAIAASSGFQRWRLEQTMDVQSVDVQTTGGLDHLVRRYLRETLETLAY